MKKRNDIFDDIDDETVEKLSNEFPVLTDEEKDRIFAMSERKYNLATEPIIESEGDVKGVERYSRPTWHRFAGIAAAIAIIAGGVGGGAAFMNSMKKSAPDKLAASEEEKVAPTETTEQTTEDVSEFAEAARALTDRYANYQYDIAQGGLETDYSSMIKFKLDSDYGGVEESVWYKVTDERYPDMASLRLEFESLFGPVDPPENLFGGEFTSAEFPEDQILPFEISNIKYITYDGQLYVNAFGYFGNFSEWSDDNIEIEKKSDNEFTAIRKGKTNDVIDPENDICRETRYVFDIIRNTRNGGWLIDSVSEMDDDSYNNADSQAPDYTTKNNVAHFNSAASAEDLIESHLTFYDTWLYGTKMPDKSEIEYNQDDFLTFNLMRDEVLVAYYRKLSDYNSLEELKENIEALYTDSAFEEIYGVDVNDFDKYDLSSHSSGAFISEEEYGAVIEYNGFVYLRADNLNPLFKILKRVDDDQLSSDESLRTIQAYIINNTFPDSSWAESGEATFEYTKDSSGNLVLNHITASSSDEQTQRVFLAKTYEGYKNLERLGNYGTFKTDPTAATIPSDDDNAPYAICTEFENTAELRNYLEAYVTPEYLDEHFPDMFEGEYPTFKDIDGKLYGKLLNSEIEIYWAETASPKDPEEDMTITNISDDEVMVEFICHSNIEDTEPTRQRMYAKISGNGFTTPWKVTGFDYPDAKG